MRKRNLTRELICEAAIQLIETDGLEKLSMRNLASKLGIEAASLYNHLANKSALYDLIQEHLFKQLIPIQNNLPWQNYLRTLATSMRKGLVQFPNVVPLFATRPTVGISAIEQIEKTFAVLFKAGFNHSQVVFIYQSLAVFVLGHALAEVGRVPGGTKEESDIGISKINKEQYPHIMKAYSKKSSSNYDKWFKFGVETLIDGLEVLLKKRSS